MELSVSTDFTIFGSLPSSIQALGCGFYAVVQGLLSDGLSVGMCGTRSLLLFWISSYSTHRGPQ